MKSSQLRSKALLTLVAAGFVCLVTTTMHAQVKTQTHVLHDSATQVVKVDRGEVVAVEGNDLIVKMEDGELRHFPNVPDNVTV